jgi:DNA polymerase
MAMLVGEAPGARENLHGKPFVGPSGILLGRLLALAGLDWEDVYVTNVVKYWPGKGNPTPAGDLVVASVPYLRREYASVKPDCLVAIGSVAHAVLGAASLRDRARKHRGRQAFSLSRVAGQHLVIKGDIDYWAMFHPSHVLRNRKVMGPVVEEHWTRFGAWLRGEE